jgi:hypothetical protein
MCSAPTSGRHPRRAPLSRPFSLSYLLVPVSLFTSLCAPPPYPLALEPSRLVLHLTTPSPLRDHILAPRLAPTLAHIVAHPPALLLHLATAQLIPPPPASRPDRFWHVFSPLSSRAWEVEEIVSGRTRHEGEMVIEVVTRAPEGVGRNLERELLGWLRDSPCLLSELDSLKPTLEDVGKTGSEVCGQPDRFTLECDHRVATDATPFLQPEPHTRTTTIPCQRPVALRPQRHASMHLR